MAPREPLVYVTALGVYDVLARSAAGNGEMVGACMAEHREAPGSPWSPIWANSTASGIADRLRRDRLRNHDNGEPFRGTEVSRKSVADLIMPLVADLSLKARGSVEVYKPGTDGDIHWRGTELHHDCESWVLSRRWPPQSDQREGSTVDVPPTETGSRRGIRDGIMAEPAWAQQSLWDLAPKTVELTDGTGRVNYRRCVTVWPPVMSLVAIPRAVLLAPAMSTRAFLLAQRRLAGAILAQTYPHREWTVLLNGGARWRTESDDHRVRIVIDDQDDGIGAAKRRACAEAEGEILVELDHDDLLAAECLTEPGFTDRVSGWRWGG